MTDSERHRPIYPAYRPGQRKHTLAWLDEDGLHLDAQTVIPVADYDQLRDVAIERALDILIRDLVDWCWLDAAIADPAARVNASGNAAVGTLSATSINWRIGNHYANAYTSADPAGDMAALTELEQSHPELGTYGSAGSFGANLMRTLVGRRQYVPATAALRDLRAGLVAGRSLSFGTIYATEAILSDRNAAYPTECLEPLPVGTALTIPYASTQDELAEYFAWYGWCTITITRKLRLGPFPQRAGPIVLYPTQPGVYRTWLWSAEAIRARAAGCKVEFEHGWGWRRGEPVLAAWATEMMRLRTSLSGRAKELAKMAANAAIGQHAMQPRHREVIRWDGQGTAVLLLHRERATDYTIKVTEDPRAAFCLHWASYIWMQARVHLYDQILAEWSTGNRVYGANTDALICERPGHVEIREGLGGWKYRDLHHFVLLETGTWLAVEDNRLPGRSGPERTALEEVYLIALDHQKRYEDSSYFARMINNPDSLDLNRAFKKGWDRG